VDTAVRKALSESLKDHRLLSIQVKNETQELKYKSLGEQLIAARDFAVGKSMDKRQEALGQRLKITSPSGLGEMVDADGGFLVQPEFSAELFQLAHQTGKLASKCRRVPIGANSNGLKWNAVDETSRAAGYRRGGISVYRTHEATAATATKPKIAAREMTLEKLAGAFYATDELLADSTALAAMVTAWFGEEFGFKMDDEIIRGGGAGEMLGILNAGCLVSVGAESNQTATTLVAENVEKMFTRMYAPSVPRAEWYINQDVWPQMFKFCHVIGATGGVAVFMPPGGLSTSPYGTLFNRPINVIEQCATLGTKGDIIFADLSQYIIIEKGGVESASSIHVKFLEGEQVFRFTVRNNGQPLWKAALTPAQGSNTTSPFVTLDART
jgi:HK97 family phage major capsid protein